MQGGARVGLQGGLRRLAAGLGPTAGSAAGLAAALVVLGLGLLAVAPFPRTNTDDVSYLGLAFSWWHGWGMVMPGEVPRAGTRFPPAWPLLLSLWYRAGFSVQAVAVAGAAVGAAALAAATGIWATLFARRIGPAAGFLAAVLPGISYRSLAVSASTSSEGLAALLVALAAARLDREPVPGRPARVAGVGYLGVLLALMVLTRTHLVLVWPVVLVVFARRSGWRAAAGAAVLGVVAAAGIAALVGAHGTADGYAAQVRAGWHGGTGSYGAHVLLGNWLGLGAVLTGPLLSPLPYVGRVAALTGRHAPLLAGWAVLALVLWGNRRAAAPRQTLLWTVPALVAPFLAGLPFPLEPRYLIPVQALIGFAGVQALRALPGRVRPAVPVVLAAWCAVSALWWVQFAPKTIARERAALADVSGALRLSAAAAPPAARICSDAPDALWRVDTTASACRTVQIVDILAGEEEIARALDRRLRELRPACTVDALAETAGERVDRVYAAAGYGRRGGPSSARVWCR